MPTLRKSYDKPTEVLSFICRFTEKNGRPPTMEETQSGLGVSSKLEIIDSMFGELEIKPGDGTVIQRE